MDNIEIMINDEAYEVITQLFDSLKRFVFDYVHLLHYKRHKINPMNRGESNIDSPDWIKSKKATLNPINKKDS